MTAKVKADWYYLSFCDGDLPEGQQFLGGCFVQANPAMAIADFPGNPGSGSCAPVLCAREAHRLKINPGGQVLNAGPLSEDKLPSMEWRNRLLTKKELVEHFQAVTLDGKPVKLDKGKVVRKKRGKR